MYHDIVGSVTLSVRWNDDEQMWEVDPRGVDSTPIEGGIGGNGGCPCGDHTQEHDEVWARAAAAPMPTPFDLSFQLQAALP